MISSVKASSMQKLFGQALELSKLPRGSNSGCPLVALCLSSMTKAMLSSRAMASMHFCLNHNNCTFSESCFGAKAALTSCVGKAKRASAMNRDPGSRVFAMSRNPGSRVFAMNRHRGSRSLFPAGVAESGVCLHPASRIRSLSSAGNADPEFILS